MCAAFQGSLPRVIVTNNLPWFILRLENLHTALITKLCVYVCIVLKRFFMHIVRGLFKRNVVPLTISFKFRQYSYLHCASYKSDIPQGAVTLL